MENSMLGEVMAEYYVFQQVIKQETTPILT